MDIWIWKEHGSQRSERTGGAGLTTDSSQHQPGLANAWSQTDRPQSAFGIPSAVSLEPLQPPVSHNIWWFDKEYIFCCHEHHHLLFYLQVLPDSFTTLSQYLNRLKQDFESLCEFVFIAMPVLIWQINIIVRYTEIGATALLVRGEVNDPLAALGRDGSRGSTSASNPATAQERLPTLASLAELLLSARLLLVEQVGDRVNVCL